MGGVVGSRAMIGVDWSVEEAACRQAQKADGTPFPSMWMPMVPLAS